VVGHIALPREGPLRVGSGLRIGTTIPAARKFGSVEIMMTPIERFFIAMTVSGCVGLIASVAWLVR
jgi:hypothetical protein